MKHNYDVIVVGGGIIGHSIAYSLSKQRISVLVLEKGTINQKASKAAAGMLAVQAEVKEKGPLFEIARKSRNMFQSLQQDLLERTGIDIELIDQGMLNIALTEEKAETLQSMISFQQTLGEEASWLSAKEASTLEPALSNQVVGAMYAPNDGQVSAPKLANSFAQAAIALGSKVLEHSEVTNILAKEGKVVGVETQTESFFSDKVIVTTGAWTKQVLQSTGLSIPVFPVKGECFSVVTNNPLLTKTIFTEECYIVPKRENRIIVGATMVPNSFDEKVSPQGINTILNKALRLVPELKFAEWEKVWAGIRPQTEDELPFIGEHPFTKGLYVSSGHYRNGILLSPITGEIMANMIQGKVFQEEFAAFSLQRVLKEASSFELND
jgi:glycine oxidase